MISCPPPCEAGELDEGYYVLFPFIYSAFPSSYISVVGRVRVNNDVVGGSIKVLYLCPEVGIFGLGSGTYTVFPTFCRNHPNTEVF